jgi:phage host-nuclease inhibitor protein Gam
MKTKRIKAPSLKTRAEFDEAVDEIARLTVELRKGEAQRDAEIQKVREQYEPAITVVTDTLKLLALSVEKFAEDHRDDLFVGKVKSSETSLAIFGFRLGQPTLKTLSKAWTWERVLEALVDGGLKRFVRTKSEPDKDAMKQHLTPEQLASVGCRIDQAETFFVEPKDRGDEGRVP